MKIAVSLANVGRREIKFSLQTRDPVVARIRNLEEMARIERAWAEIDGTRITNPERVAAHLTRKFVPATARVVRGRVCGTGRFRFPDAAWA